MNRFLLLIITGLLLQIKLCSGSPVLLLDNNFCLSEFSWEEINFASNLLIEKNALPEGIITRESTGIVLKENKRLVAAFLAVTLGMLGVHRLYLGTKPWIPLVYLLTFGGGFFILPLIDLIAILTAKDLDKYLNNPRVFMWIEPEKQNQEVEK